MTLQDTLHFTQIAFYIAGGTVAVLTYLKAKNGLLNSVNTEYQKHVIERLAEVSAELGAEYDWDSPKHWSKVRPVEQVLSRMHDEWLPHKEAIIQSGEPRPGIPISDKYLELRRMGQTIRSDPFIPVSLRDLFVDFYEERANVMGEAFRSVIENYQNHLASGQGWGTLDTNHAYVHNQILERMREKGCGIEEIEEEVHQLRDAVRDYFRQFNPIVRE